MLHEFIAMHRGDIVVRASDRVRGRPWPSVSSRLSVTALVDEIAAAGVLHAEYRGIRFTVVPVAPALTVDGDPQLLTSAGTGNLFQPFGDRRGGDRSGLGLSIARQAVRAHRGHIHIHNLPGEGCIVTIDVPMAAGDVRVPQSV